MRAEHCIGSRLQSIWDGVLGCTFTASWYRCFTLVAHLGAKIHLVQLPSLQRDYSVTLESRKMPEGLIQAFPTDTACKP